MEENKCCTLPRGIHIKRIAFYENENVVKEEISIGNIEKSKIATELAGPDSLSSRYNDDGDDDDEVSYNIVSEDGDDDDL